MCAKVFEVLRAALKGIDLDAFAQTIVVAVVRIAYTNTELKVRIPCTPNLSQSSPIKLFKKLFRELFRELFKELSKGLLPSHSPTPGKTTSNLPCERLDRKLRSLMQTRKKAQVSYPFFEMQLVRPLQMWLLPYTMLWISKDIFTYQFCPSKGPSCHILKQPYNRRC